MEKNHISWARVSKNICYFLAPIFGVLLIACIAGLIITDTAIELEDANNYYETNMFSNRYITSISSSLYSPTLLEYNSKEEQDDIIYDRDTFYDYTSSNVYDVQRSIKINGKDGTIFYKHSNKANFKYLIINEKKAIAVTNLEHTMNTDTIEEIKKVISSNNVYWNYDNGKIHTNISNLSLEQIKYKRQYQAIEEQDISQIYTSLLSKLPYKDDYLLEKVVYDYSVKANTLAPILIPVCIAILLALGLIILNGIGKKGKAPGIHLNSFDKLPLGIAILVSTLIGLIGAAFFITLRSEVGAIIFIGIVIGLIIMYLAAILLLETVVKRLKTHTLWKSTIIYKLGHLIKVLFENRKITTKLILFYGGFCIIALIITSFLFSSYSTRNRSLALLTLAALGIGTFAYLFIKARQLSNIENALKQIYEGNTDVKLNKNELTGTLKKLGIYIDDIAGGLSNAVEQSLKSERLKTELITNVSHDIKTPLTSIINYVDLLKKEKMPNEKATEYLMILENKSQRLKKLTEDLVEASKASSGNIKLNKEKINVIELVKQVSGEFEDRFKTRGIEEIMTLPEEQIFIEVDGRYMYRILENLYSNASKYALENTRIYVDVISQKQSVVIQMKNVSKEKLNITADELMQRFVRGDSSRNTEGSGLGLSIASSLTELQGGKFHIYLDGDLFKVTLGFERVKD